MPNLTKSQEEIVKYFLLVLIIFASVYASNMFTKNVFVSNDIDASTLNGLEIALGNYEGFDSIYKYGRNENVGTTEEVLWDGGGEYIFLSSAETIDVVSNDADDTLLGAGARKVVLFGLDSNYNDINETIELNGTTPVTTTKSFLRTFRAYVLEVGSVSTIQDNNQGTISFTSSSTATLQAQILPSNGQTFMCVYTIPANKTGYFTNADTTTSKGSSSIVKLKARQCFDIDCPFNTKAVRDVYQTSFTRYYFVPRKVTEKIDIVMTAEAENVGTPVTCSFEIVLVDNN